MRMVMGGGTLWGVALLLGSTGPVMAGCGADRMENARLYEQCKAAAAGDMYALGRCGSEQTTRYRAWEARCGAPSDPRTDTITVLNAPPSITLGTPLPGGPTSPIYVPPSGGHVPPSGSSGKMAPNGTTTYIVPPSAPPTSGTFPPVSPPTPALNVPMMKSAPAGKGGSNAPPP